MCVQRTGQPFSNRRGGNNFRETKLITKANPTYLVFLGIIHHSLNLVLSQTALVIGDGDLVFLARGLVLSTDVQQAICIDVKGHIDLRHTTRCRWDAVEIERAQQMVVLGHGALTLEDLDMHTGLLEK